MKSHIAWLKDRARQVQVFGKGSLIMQQRDAWRKASLKTRQTPFAWVLWAPPQLAGSPKDYEFDRYGIPPGHSITTEDRLYGPMSKYYGRPGVIAATDGSVQEDGAMGAAATALHCAFEDKLVGISGNGSSTATEMVGLSAAVNASPGDLGLTILTDSLTTLRNLQRRQCRDFARLDPNPQLTSKLNSLVALLNAKADTAPDILLVKVKGHSGDPLNERADWLANLAAELDPTESCDDDDTIACRLQILGSADEPKRWSARMAQRLIQAAAENRLQRCFRVPWDKRDVQDWMPNSRER